MWKTGFLLLSFFCNGEFDLVEVCPPLPSLRDIDQPDPLKLLNEPIHRRHSASHALCELLLARKAEIVIPRVSQKEGVHDLGAFAEVGVFKNEIRHLGKPTKNHGVLGNKFDVSFTDDIRNVLHVTLPALHHGHSVPQVGRFETVSYPPLLLDRQVSADDPRVRPDLQSAKVSS